MKKIKIGIMGATGTVGSELIKLLSHTDAEIHAYCRNINISFNQANIKPHFFDFDKIKPDTFKDIEKLFWLTPNQFENFQTNEWLYALNNSRIKQIVQLSSMHPQIFHLDHFEQLLEQAQIPYTILRANTFMQNFNKYETESILKENAFYFPGGSGKTSFIDIRDIAKAIANILLIENNWNKIYTLTGNEALDYYQIASILADVTGKPVKYIDTWSFPEYETDANKSNQMRQLFFKGVRNTLFSEVAKDLQHLLRAKSITFEEYANDYWRQK